METKETKATEVKETVKVKVVIPFRDKTKKDVIFEVGQELDFDKERAEDVTTRGLAEYILPEG